MPAVRSRHPPARPHLLDLTSADEKKPGITIIAPTPRQSTFSFPAAHNLADSPYASPSSSPFESESDWGLRGLALSSPSTSPFSPDDDDHAPATPSSAKRIPATVPAPLPLSAYMRVLTPVPSSPLHSILSSASPSPSPSTPGASRRGRTASADGRPKKGDADYVKRPENAFILFRRQACAEHAGSSSSPSSPSPASSPPSTSTSSSPLPTPAPAPITLVGLPAKARQADLSKAISAQWRALSAEERAKWEAMAAEKKREHEEKYPGYVYRPRKKPPRGSTNVADLERMSLTPTPMPMPIPPPHQPLAPSVEFVLPAPRLPLPRSSSVPPPPHPYHTIQIPNVYAGGYHTYSPFTASSSPPTNQTQDFSLLPMIMASASKRESTNTSGFDYLPAAGEAGNTMSSFEANLMTSDFLRSMFTNPDPSPTPLDTALALELSPASSPEPELATPGPGPGPSYNASPLQDCSPGGCLSPQQQTWPAAYPLPLPHSHLDANFDSAASIDFGFGVDFNDFALGSVPPPSFGGEFQGWDMPVGELDMDMDMGMGMDMGIGMEAWDGVDPMQLQASASGS
ncbi:hypothetical protein C8F01DRAFT_1262623 [Mycena amicta]|nr:hypothetical protein C8F01DRAFT_1262623 [Mycena amicta]